MIGTIGSLVQETANRRRWLLASSLYTVACVGTASLLGAVLAAVGQFLRQVLRHAALPGVASSAPSAVVGILAIAYAASDLGMIRLPRPTLMYAVPVTWWRHWRPYGAAALYGAALGLGVTTKIAFGAFYVLYAWCLLSGEAGSAALLMGTYGAARALVLFPASWGFQHHGGHHWLYSPLFRLQRAQSIMALALVAFGAYVVMAYSST